MDNKIATQEDIMKMLDVCYDKALHGINRLSPPIEQFASDYIKKRKNEKESVKEMLNNQVAKCTV
jgi:hypothetical protein